MPITRFYHAAEDADTAVGDLRRAGFRPSALHVIGPPDATAETIRRRGIAPARAERYATLVRGGMTLVLVDFALGFTGTATAILEQPRAHDQGPPAATYERLGYDPVTPLSSWFAWPVLLHDPAPLSRLLRLSTLSRRQRAPRSSLGAPTVARRAAPLSSLLRLRVLTDNAAPLSSRAGMRVLLPQAAPFSAWIGRPVLLADAAPLSRRLGWRLLSRGAAPLSAWLGLKQLSRDPAPLSRWLRLKVLSSD